MKKFLLNAALAFTMINMSYAQAPKLFNYQGVARNTSGVALANQSLGLKISILEGSASGTVVYAETQQATTNAFGLYNLSIGNGTAVTGTMAGVDWATGDKYIKVEIDPSGGTTYTSLGATQLLSVPFALYAASGTPGPQGITGPAGPQGATGPQGPAGLSGATGAQGPQGPGGATGATGLQGPAGSANVSGATNTLMKFTGATTGGNSQLTDDGTSVGLNVGTLSPNVKLQVNATGISNTMRGLLGTAPATSIATSGSIYGESATGIGVIGVSGTQNGVYGLSTGTLGGTVGVATGTGNGIWGVATGAGIAGFFDGGVTGRGIIVSTGASGFGTTTPTSRLTVMQPATPVPAIDTFPAITGYSYTAQGCLKGGVYGNYNGSNYGTGIQGIGYNGVNNQDVNSIFTTGNQDIGVYGSANTAGVEGASVNGIGVVGYNKNASFAATTGGGNAYGVYGYANTIGGATAPTTRYGVYGYAVGATTNYAGYFSGNVQVTGSISKGSGTFKIDHPVDPENKYLYHSFVESPDMMNIYNGNITTDANGYATVKLPAYFQALNKEFRYQLTVIGAFAQAIVSEEVNADKFVIQTNQPNIKVSWQVTGIRHDKYAEAHRVVAEVEKEPEFKGKYLHAAEWGKPADKSIDAVTRPKETLNSDKTAIPATKTGQQTESKARANTTGGAELKTK
ncbi:collagen-like protein [Taibaiella sp. KBW10]|uniref:collagen-like protein n=1 Tax=Taibaiella sp. KBW10 TaxID=2153357 RepID=UPI000F5AEF9B|nr:collagen-like protein [Taibaiella sp. KBW10]